ncbi:Lipase [Operophtera brumata]|uniref:Lipase n=1 Tax=Operophtera brumata TaxID=104452 RepID=A0A0L7L403_OPEBR|nr:Lipase [Operophtera brumata]
MNLFIIFLLLDYWSLNAISATNTEVAIIRRDLNFTGMVNYDGFLSETHTVRTKDGYILTLYRVSSPNCSALRDSEPIMFMHGLFLSGDDCITPGPSGSHCYEYASACLDVWVPNARGTVYSRSHISLNPDTDSEYWNFSFDEMAQYDMPAVIDYVINATNKNQITYIGHAQAVATLLNLCAAKPEYNAKIKVGFGLSPTAWLYNCRFSVIQIDGALSTVLTGLIEAGLNAEFLPRGGVYQPFVKLLCGTTDLSYPACSDLLFAVLGNDSYQITEDTMKVLTGHLPGGTSLKNFNRWGQIYKNGFTKYDHGSVKNLLEYGTLTPPVFDLSNVTMKWIFITSYGDYVSNVTDVDTLIANVSNATKCIVSDKTFGHLDYLFGKDVPTMITPMITTYVDTGKFECL